MLFIQNDHRIINRDDPDQPAFFIHHRRGNQMVLVECISNLTFILQRRDYLEHVFDQIAQWHLAACPHQFAQRDIADGMGPRIHEDHVIELFGQRLAGAQEVNGLANIPVFRRHDNFALHQAAGRLLGVGQRLLDSDAVTILQHIENDILLLRAQILDQVHNIVGFQLAHRISQNFGAQLVQNILADALIQFGQDVAVKVAVVQRDQIPPVIGRDLLQKVGDIGCVERLQQRAQAGLIALPHSRQNRSHIAALKLVVAVLRLAQIGARIRAHGGYWISHGPIIGHGRYMQQRRRKAVRDFF